MKYQMFNIFEALETAEKLAGEWLIVRKGKEIMLVEVAA